MALPVPVVTSAIEAISRAIESKYDYERERLHASIRVMELQVARERNQAQREILLSLIEASRHVFDRKMDAFIEAFRVTNKHIARRQSELVEEKRQIEAQNDKIDMSINEKRIIARRLREINNNLHDLDIISLKAQKEFNLRVASLEPDISIRNLPAPRYPSF